MSSMKESDWLLAKCCPAPTLFWPNTYHVFKNPRQDLTVPQIPQHSTANCENKCYSCLYAQSASESVHSPYVISSFPTSHLSHEYFCFLPAHSPSRLSWNSLSSFEVTDMACKAVQLAWFEEKFDKTFGPGSTAISLIYMYRNRVNSSHYQQLQKLTNTYTALDKTSQSNLSNLNINCLTYRHKNSIR